MKQYNKLLLTFALATTFIKADPPEDMHLDSSQQHYEVVRKCAQNDPNNCVDILRIFCNQDLSSYRQVGKVLRSGAIMSQFQTPTSIESATEEEIDQLQQQAPSFHSLTRDKNKAKGRHWDDETILAELPFNQHDFCKGRKLRKIGRLFYNMTDVEYRKYLMHQIEVRQAYYATTDPAKQDRILESWYNNLLPSSHNPIEQTINSAKKNQKPPLEEFKKEMKQMLEKDAVERESTPQADARFYLFKYCGCIMVRFSQLQRFLEDQITNVDDWLKERNEQK